jgi:hypothetical protein
MMKVRRDAIASSLLSVRFTRNGFCLRVHLFAV